ncbi:MAG: hypothetical protein ACRBF0_23100 [Calditrichia bacterium]
MFFEVKPAESLRKRRVIRQFSLVDTLAVYAMPIGFTGLPIGYLLSTSQVLSLNENFSAKVFFILLSFPIIAWIIAWIIAFFLLRDKLIRVPGISFEKNWEMVKQLAEEKEHLLHRHNKKYSAIIYPVGKDSWSKWYELIIIYDKVDIWVNCRAFTRINTRSLFIWFDNRKVEVQFIKSFQEKRASVQA